jgi:hypothetical protein
LYDQVVVNGPITLQSGTINLALNLGFDPADGVDSFTLLLNTVEPLEAPDVLLSRGGRFRMGTSSRLVRSRSASATVAAAGMMSCFSLCGAIDWRTVRGVQPRCSRSVAAGTPHIPEGRARRSKAAAVEGAGVLA